ncbi:MAG: hypothetical protein V1902_02965 [Candidatus Falkowbacteria bacterium]
MEKIFISAILLFILLGGRALVMSVLKLCQNDALDGHNGVVFVLSLFLLFNHFVYDRALYGQFGILAAYGALLFLFAYSLRTLKELNPRYLIYAIASATISIMFAIHFIFLVAIIFLLLFWGLFAQQKLIRARKLNKSLWQALFLSVLIFLILNANWLAFFFLGEGASLIAQDIGRQDLNIFKTAGITQTEAVSNVFFMGGFWAKDMNRYVDMAALKQNWGRSFFLLLPLICWGVIKGLRNSKQEPNLFYFTIGLIIIFATTFILALGISTPFSSKITLLLFNNFPLYKGMREPQKWVALIVIIYTIFLSIGVKEFFKLKIIAKDHILFKIILTLVIIMQAPLLLWGFGGQIKPVDYPKDWYRVDKITAGNAISQKCDDKILFLPWHMYMGFQWVGRVIANPAKVFFQCPVISGTNMEAGPIYDNSGDPTGQKVAAWISAQGETNLFVSEKIKYIILAKEVDWQGYAWINSLTNLQLIKDSETLKLYKVVE